ncbi:unnamed protein product, partial [marine sediment metagenome]
MTTPKKIKTTTEKVKAADAMVEFAAVPCITLDAGAGDDNANVPFEMVAYTGASIPTWMWGDVVVDI